MNNRKLLVVAFHYPPDNTSTGVLRTLKFTQYLEKFGWTCDVLSVEESMYTNTDPSLAERIPSHTHVYRTRGYDIKQSFSIWGMYPGILAMPDRYWPWIRGAVKQGIQLLQTGEYSAIYATYPHPSALIVGAFLKRKSGLPLLIDFRDPWVENSMPRLNRVIEGYLEKRIVNRADRVICNTPAMRTWLLQRYANEDEKKFVTITNGFDEPDFADLEPEPIEKFEILYPGIIDNENRDPEPLLAAIALCIQKGWLAPEDLQLTFLGCGPYGHGEKFLDDLQRFGLAELAEITESRIPYKNALARLAGADIVVVLSEPILQNRHTAALREWTHMQVPAKVYEYLRLGRPILALVSGGAVADVLKHTGQGITIPPLETEKVAGAIRTLYMAHKQGNKTPASKDIYQFSRENLTAQLAKQLEQLVGPPK